jgi:hypothetical protein
MMEYQLLLQYLVVFLGLALFCSLGLALVYYRRTSHMKVEAKALQVLLKTENGLRISERAGRITAEKVIAGIIPCDYNLHHL